jgi:hypothetical protein
VILVVGPTLRVLEGVPPSNERIRQMKEIIILIISCFSVFAADNNIRVISSSKTNAVSGRIFTMEVFTRNGQTNLVRTTVTRQGIPEGPLQKFYHDGVLVGECWTFQDSSGFITEAGSPYSVIVKYWPSKNASQAFICTRDRVVLDYFTSTNGMFYPADGSAVQAANKMTTEMSKAISEMNKATSPNQE